MRLRNGQRHFLYGSRAVAADPTESPFWEQRIKAFECICFKQWQIKRSILLWTSFRCRRQSQKNHTLCSIFYAGEIVIRLKIGLIQVLLRFQSRCFPSLKPYFLFPNLFPDSDFFALSIFYFSVWDDMSFCAPMMCLHEAVHVNEKIRGILWVEICQQGGLPMHTPFPAGCMRRRGDPPLWRSTITVDPAEAWALFGKDDQARSKSPKQYHPSWVFLFPAMVNHCFTLFLNVPFSYFGRDCVRYNVYFLRVQLKILNFEKCIFTPEFPFFGGYFHIFGEMPSPCLIRDDFFLPHGDENWSAKQKSSPFTRARILS